MRVIRVAVDAALDLARSIFIAHGASEQNAAVVAEHLVGNDCAGVSSHGIHRVVQYTDDIRSGLLRPAAVPAVKTIAPTRLHVEGGEGFGQVGAMAAVDAATQAVAAGGTVVVAALNGGLCVVRPDGEISYVRVPGPDPGDTGAVGYITTPGPLATNICWGGEDMTTAYVTEAGEGKLVAYEWPRPGLRLAFNR